MRPDQQVRVLSKIWGNRKGYVFLPWIDGGKGKARKQHYHEGRAYLWPKDKPAIIEHLTEHASDDLYFSVQVFNGKRRVEELADIETRLWADLDEVDPRTIEEDLKPTIAWESSPGRFQAVWVMQGGRHGASLADKENHRLTHYLGADPSGWDTTQLLRVPGSLNNKPDNIEKNGGTPPRGKLLWDARGIFTWEDVDHLPSVTGTGEASEAQLIDETLLQNIDRHEVWGRIRLSVSPQVREYMRAKDSTGADRSEIAWQIERDLADAGLSLAEIIAVIRPTVWNKFAGRQDELRRLVTEVTKALAAKKEEQTGVVLEEDMPKLELVPFWQDESYLNQEPPVWLVEDLIPEGGCGFIAGIPKSMKSWLALDLAISMSAGVPFLDREIPETKNVLYIQQEDPGTLVLERHHIIASSKAPSYDPLGANLRPSGGALYVVIHSGFSGADTGWQAWLDEQVGKHDIDLVIMDTLATVAGGINVDKANEVKSFLLDPIKVIGRTHNCAMLFVHHMTKASDNERAGQNMSGSGQIHAWADFGIYARNKDDQNRLTFQHETKYTGTVNQTFWLKGLDDEPKRWEPEEVLMTDRAATQGSIVHTDGTIDVDLSDEPSGKKLPKMHEQKREAKIRNQARARELADAGKDLDFISRAVGVSVRTVKGYLKD